MIQSYIDTIMSHATRLDNRPEMLRQARSLAVALVLVWVLPALAQEKPPAVRCAVIGGLIETDFWPDLAARFEQAADQRTEIVASGPKHAVAEAFESGTADLIVMHAGDTIINLVADGYGENPQPWARNDMVIVGPAADPARIKGEKDAAAALRKIVASGSKLLFHSSNGASEVLRELLEAAAVTPEPEQTIVLPSDKHRETLKKAAEAGAYTLIGRIPFLNGKLPPGEMQVMVQGDVRLRRAYLVVTRAGRADDPRLAAARKLAAFLREAETQKFIAAYGRGRYDDQPLFFPVVVRGE